MASNTARESPENVAFRFNFFFLEMFFFFPGSVVVYETPYYQSAAVSLAHRGV